MQKEKIALSRGYFVNCMGDLYYKNNERKLRKNTKGYFDANIRIGGKLHHLSPHRLQAYQKYGNDLYGEGIQVRHLNGNPEDNTWENIAIGTQFENMQDIPPNIRRLNSSLVSKKHPHHKIISYYNKVKSYKLTMNKFNLSSKGTLFFILNKSIALEESKGSLG